MIMFKKKMNESQGRADTKQNVMGKVGENKLAEFLKDNNYIRIEDKYDFSIWNKMPKD